MAQWVTLIGRAYVIARGLNNFVEATRKEVRIPESASN
jgi:hypothetical protein